MNYLCAPYQSPTAAVRDTRIDLTRREVELMLRGGKQVYCASLYWHAFKDTIIHSGDILTHDTHMIAMCDEFWVLTLPGWEQCHDVRRQLDIAKSLATPIKFVTPTCHS